MKSILDKFNTFFIWINKKTISAKAISVFLCALLLFSVGALLLAGMYTLPQADDYGFSAGAHSTWVETNSIAQTISTAFQKAIYTYETWQGSYSACFLMALQPGIFGWQAYAITPFFLLGTFLLATWFFAFTIRKFFMPRSPKVLLLICTCTLLLLQLYNTPYPNESWYWYNGAVYYTFYYTLTLLCCTFAMFAYFTKSKIMHLLFSLLLGFLGFFIGGGSYNMIMLCLALLLLGVINAVKNRLLSAIPLSIGAAALSIGFILNATAPGNSVRATYFESPGVIKTIYLAIINALSFILRWTNLTVVIILLLLLPVLWKLARFCSVAFKLPLVAMILSFGLYAALFCPPIYAMNNVGPGRMQNVIFFSYVWLLIFNAFYFCGWAQRHWSKGEIAATAIHDLVRQYGITIILCCFAFIGVEYTVGLYRENPPVQAAAIVLNGEAQQFYDELLARIPLYEDESLEDVIVTPLSVTPYPIYHDDLSDDAFYFANANIAEYFGKKSVVMDFSQNENS